jgi:hypothetical protein
VSEYTVVGTWDEEGVRNVIGVIEGRLNVIRHVDVNEPTFTEVVEAETQEAAFWLLHGKLDEAMAEMKKGEPPC